MDKSPDAFRTISEVADWLGTPTHVLRFWESRFTQVKPVKRAGGRRYYRPKDMALLGGIKRLLHDDGMTIRGVQKLLRENGIAHVEQMSQPLGDGGNGATTDAEAPIDIDVEPENVENVVQLKKEKGPVIYADSGEPEVGPRGEILRGPSQDDLRQPSADISVEKNTAPAEPVDEQKPAPEPVAEEQSLAPSVQETPEPSAPEKPTPFVLENESDPDETFNVPGITGVAAALRAAAKSDSQKKPEPEVFAELYERLKTLRSQMDRATGPNSAD